jgi:hypothetical protein
MRGRQPREGESALRRSRNHSTIYFRASLVCRAVIEFARVRTYNDADKYIGARLPCGVNRSEAIVGS